MFDELHKSTGKSNWRSEKGEEVRLLEDGITEIGGRLPVNASSGLLSKGHPVNASSVAQIAEIVWQLRGQAGDRRVPDAKVGLAYVIGGEVMAWSPGLLRRIH